MASCFGYKVLRSAKGKRSPESLLPDTDEVRSERESTRAYDERPHSKRSKRGQGGRGRMQARASERARGRESEREERCDGAHTCIYESSRHVHEEREREGGGDGVSESSRHVVREEREGERESCNGVHA